MKRSMEPLSPSQVPDPQDSSSGNAGRKPARQPLSQVDMLKSYGYGPGSPKLGKLNQMVQNFFMKAASIIFSTRLKPNDSTKLTSSTKRANKWFNLELEDIDLFREELKPWKTLDLGTGQVSPLIIETVLDIRDLTPNQSLVILDSSGRRFTVSRSDDPTRPRPTEIVLEEWIVGISRRTEEAIPPELPLVYKKCIVLFRSMYMYSCLLPVWRFRRKLQKSKINSSALRIFCRVTSSSAKSTSKTRIGLTERLSGSSKEAVAQRFAFGSIDSPAGLLHLQVSYRTDCEFRVDDSDTLLSSHFLNMDRNSKTQLAASRRTSYGASPSSIARSVEYRQRLINAESGSTPSSPNTTTTAAAAATAVNDTDRRRSAVYTSSSGDSITSRSREDSTNPAVAYARFLRNSVGSSTSARSPEDSLLTSRRPSISMVRPFKSPSLSASPSSLDAPSQSPRYGRANTSTTPVDNLHRNSTDAGHVASGVKASSLESNVSSSGSSGSRPVSLARFGSSFSSRSQWHVSRSPADTKGGAVLSNQSSTAYDAPGSGFFDDDSSLADFVRLISEAKPLKGTSATERSSKEFEDHDGSSSSVNGEGPMKNSLQVTSGFTAEQSLDRYLQIAQSHSLLTDSISASVMASPSSRSPSVSPGTADQVSGHASRLSLPSQHNQSSAQSSGSPSSLNLGASVKATSPSSLYQPAIPSRLSEGLTAAEAFEASNLSKQSQISDGKDGDGLEEGPCEEDMGSASRGAGRTQSSGVSPLDIPKIVSHPLRRHPSASFTRERHSGDARTVPAGILRGEQDQAQAQMHQGLSLGTLEIDRLKHDEQRQHHRHHHHHHHHHHHDETGHSDTDPYTTGGTADVKTEQDDVDTSHDTTSAVGPSLAINREQESSYQHRLTPLVHDDDELLFAMSDMAISRDNNAPPSSSSSSTPHWGNRDLYDC